MKLNTIEGHPGMVRGTALTQTQMDVVKAIVKFHKGETKLTQAQLRIANAELFGKTYAPYFIIKNLACKGKERGAYNLGVLKLKAEKAPKAKAEASKGRREARKAKSTKVAAVAI